MGTRQFLQHFPWVSIVVAGLFINWFWWIDAALNPAVTVYHEQTVVLDVTLNRRTEFEPGEIVLIRGYGHVNRVCGKQYKRTLTTPDGENRDLPRGEGTRFQEGEGSNTIVIQTQRWWPVGAYEFLSVGIHDCNPPFPPQIIPGFHARFNLRG